METTIVYHCYFNIIFFDLFDAKLRLKKLTRRKSFIESAPARDNLICWMGHHFHLMEEFSQPYSLKYFLEKLQQQKSNRVEH